MAQIFTNDVTISISSDISGSGAYENITDRVIAIDKIHETCESSPGEFLISEFGIELNNFDGWYDSIFLNYFYDDPINSGSGKTYFYIVQDGIPIWIGYVKEPPEKDIEMRSVKMKIIHIAGLAKETTMTLPVARRFMVNVIYEWLDLITDSIDYFDHLYSLIRDKTIQDTGTLYVYLQTARKDYGPDQPPSGYSWGTYSTPGSFDLARMIKNMCNLSRCFFTFYPIYYNGAYRYIPAIIDKNRDDELLGGALDDYLPADVTLTNDDIISYKPMVNYWKYSKVIAQGNGVEGEYTIKLDTADELSLDHYYRPTGVSSLNRCARFAQEYYQRQRTGVIVEANGLQFFGAQRCTIPSGIGSQTDFIIRELYRNIETRSTELHLVPQITGLPFKYQA